MSLETLYESTLEDAKDTSLIDVIAIHDLGESSSEAWTHPKSGVNWLKDLLPVDLGVSLKPRILSYGYEADASTFLGDEAINGITQLAQTLVSSLQAVRGLDSASQRPIIFICHGLGGIIVKKALVFSATQVSNKVIHNYSIYISTFGILFLGTPHEGFERGFVRHCTHGGRKSGDLDMIMARHEVAFKSVADQFAQLMKQYHVFFFWEQHRTKIGHHYGFVVRVSSAAPSLDNTDRCGISANHSEMGQFADRNASSYRTILGAVLRYTKEAQVSIASRWRNAIKYLNTQRSIEASELVGFDVHDNNRPFMYVKTPKTPQEEFQGLRNKYFHVPHRVSSIFTGQIRLHLELRKKMIKPAWSHSPPRRRVFVLCGMGGSGKTQFCLKFVQDHMDSFWAVFWVDASSVENAERAFSHIGKVGGLGENHQAGVYWLAGLKMPWMLVIDNADDPSIDYSRFFPGGDRGHILLTSRLQDCKTYATVGFHDFRSMEEEDAIVLLLRAAGKSINEEKSLGVARKIVRALGCLPLALAQAGAAIKQDICTLEDYLETYETHKVDLLNRRVVQDSESHHHSTFTTFDVTVQRIERERSEIASDAMEILQVFAFLHFEQVPLSMFHKAWTNLRRWPHTIPPKTLAMRLSERVVHVPSFSALVEKVAHSLQLGTQARLPDILGKSKRSWNQLRFREAVAVLENHSLIYRDAGEGDTCSMHPLVHSWARHRLSSPDQRIWADVSANTLASSISPDSEAIDETYRISLIPHINACLKNDHACTILQGRINGYQMSKSIRFAGVYSEGGFWKEAAALQSRLLEIKKNSAAYRSIDDLDIMMSLANSHWNLDQVGECLKLSYKVVKLSEKTVGQDDPKTLRAKDKLAEILWLIGRRQEAKALGEDTVERLRKILGSSHPFALDAMDNLGRTMLHLALPREARRLHQEALDGRERLLGASHPKTLMAMANLGMSFHALKDLDQAEGLLDTVFHERCRILGHEHAYTLWAINDLAKIRCDQGYPMEAERMLTSILDTVVRTLGKEHIGMCMTKQNLVRAYIAQQRWAESKDTLLDLMEVQKKKQMSPEHPDRIQSAMDLARVVKHLGELDEAELMIREVVELSRKVHGSNDRRTRNAEGQLVSIQIAKGELDSAEILDANIGQTIDLEERVPFRPGRSATT